MTRGGRNTKIHAIADGLGNPLYVQLTGGQIRDITVAYDLLKHVDVSGSVVMADKAYGAADFRIKTGKPGASYCIPPKADTAEPWEADWWQYKERSRVECFFQKIKNYRRIATRYDKLAVRFLGFVHLVCILVWLISAFLSFTRYPQLVGFSSFCISCYRYHHTAFPVLCKKKACRFLLHAV